MTTLLIIYIIGFIVTPIITVALDKIFPGSMGLDEEFIFTILVISAFWYVTLFFILFLLLEYWYKN